MKHMLSGIALIAVLLGGSAAPVFAQQAPADQGGSQSTLPGSVLPELYDRGGTRLDAGDYEGAALDFSLFLLLNPTYSQGYFARALSEMALGDHTAAITDLTRAMDFAPPESPRYVASLFGLRGQVHQQDGDFDLAFDDYSSAIDLDPSGDNYTSRAFLLAGILRFDEALEDLNHAIELLPEVPLLALARANVYGQLQENGASALEYLRYVDLTQTDVRNAGELSTDGTPAAVQMANGSVFLFGFEGNQGQLASIRAEARGNAAVDPLIILLDANGVPIAANDDASSTDLSATLRQIELPDDGTYTVLLTHALGGDTGGVVIGMLLQES